ncbi:MAG: hypothetical protein MZV64_14050 [Ignavibacteriales bacterium]|nr:hypothetical protein [Ignavibacteriales bacterium]
MGRRRAGRPLAGHAAPRWRSSAASDSRSSRLCSKTACQRLEVPGAQVAEIPATESRTPARRRTRSTPRMASSRAPSAQLARRRRAAARPALAVRPGAPCLRRRQSFAGRVQHVEVRQRRRTATRGGGRGSASR